MIDYAEHVHVDEHVHVHALVHLPDLGCVGAEEEEEDRRDGAWEGRDELFFRERDFFLPSNRVALSPKVVYVRVINRRGKK